MRRSPSDMGLPARAGIGLKPAHFEAVLQAGPALGFVEVHAENYMLAGGPMHHFLGRIRDQLPLSIHGVGLSIGGTGPVDEAHLDRLKILLDRYEPQAFSEHLAWSSHGGRFYNDLLPVPYDRPTLDRVCAHVDRVQHRLRRPMLLENPSTYVEFTNSVFSETQFLREILRRTGCGLLLDVNNLHVSCTNHGRDAIQALDQLPLDAVGEIHIAGFAQDQDSLGAALLIDHHGAPVDDAVWALYAQALARLGPCPTLLERDNDLPAFDVLLAEASQAERLMQALPGSASHGRAHASA